MQYILSSDSLTAFVKGKPYTVNRTAEIFNAAMQAVKEGSEQAFLNVVEIKKEIVKHFSDYADVVLEDNRLMYGNREITGLIAKRVMELLDHGLDVKPMLNFVSNLMANPSKRAVDETFGFVDACKLPITEDGCILAYRRVRADYFDQHSRTVPNKPAHLFTQEELNAMPIVCGKQNEVTVSVMDGRTFVDMDRNLVDEDKDRTCSQGLHFCSYEYLQHFPGERIIVVKINPCDIVAIPSDYNNAKGRTCSYEIVDEIALDGESQYAMPVAEIDYDYAIDLETMVDGETSLRNFQIKQDLANGMSIRKAAVKYNLSRRQIARVRDKN